MLRLPHYCQLLLACALLCALPVRADNKPDPQADSKAAPDNSPANLAALSWLSGCWISENDEAGSGEYWSSAAGGSLFGIGRTLRAGKVVTHEFMQIHLGDDGKLLFTAHPSGKKSASFTQIKLSAGEVVFENPAHDFPQRVLYRQLGENRILGRIEGSKGGQPRSIDYPMRKTSCDAAGK